MNARLISGKVWLPVFIFVLLFLLVPLRQFDHLLLMPGNLGDARLNNYFLENIYRYLSGQSSSLWNLSFFFPFPYVIGFSDNLFGASPIYVMGRLLFGKPDTAFQFWFLVGYAANYFSTYFVLRRLGLSQIAASVGGVVFAFALPTSAHAGHAQLHYRAGIPLSIFYFTRFLEGRKPGALVIAFGWLVWQFYCGIYMGFFNALFLAAIGIVFGFRELAIKRNSISLLAQGFVEGWQGQMVRARWIQGVALLTSLGLLYLLFYPYMKVSELYGFTRSWEEISSMLPRPTSYLYTGVSSVWYRLVSPLADQLPLFHEHQMFIGLSPLLLMLAGLIGFQSQERQAHGFLFFGALIMCIVLTIDVGGASLWYFISKLPLASAIRAVSRLDQVFLFPVAYFAARVVDGTVRERKLQFYLVCAALLFMVIEFSAVRMQTTPKELWRERIDAANARVPLSLGKDDVLFIGQPPLVTATESEVDAMWVALYRGVPTLNGFSGSMPPGASLEFGKDCSELPIRVMSYLRFIKREDDVALYRSLTKSIQVAELEGCHPEWISAPPVGISKNFRYRAYGAFELKDIRYSVRGHHIAGGRGTIDFLVANDGPITIFANSDVGKPISVSWRCLDANATPLMGWDPRVGLPSDIGPHAGVEITVPVDITSMPACKTIQLSMVQDAVFWLHDIGVAPATLKMN